MIELPAPNIVLRLRMIWERRIINLDTEIAGARLRNRRESPNDEPLLPIVSCFDAR